MVVWFPPGHPSPCTALPGPGVGGRDTGPAAARPAPLSPDSPWLAVPRQLDPSVTTGRPAPTFVSSQDAFACVARLLPSVCLFYGLPSTFVWQQGDPLMPALFAPGISPALFAWQSELRPDEAVRAFLDDNHVSTTCSRMRAFASMLQKPGRGTRQGLSPLASRLRLVMLASGAVTAPLGSDEYINAYLHFQSAQHRTLLEKLPARERKIVRPVLPCRTLLVRGRSCPGVMEGWASAVRPMPPLPFFASWADSARVTLATHFGASFPHRTLRPLA